MPEAEIPHSAVPSFERAPRHVAIIMDGNGRWAAARAIFPNCPRYIPNMQMTGPSIYTPQPKCEPPEPAWKGFDAFKDVVHPRQPTWKG